MAGSLGGRASKVAGSPQWPTSVLTSSASRRSNSPPSNSAARSEASVSGCMAPGRPNSVITEPPWYETTPCRHRKSSRLVLSLNPKNGLAWARISSPSRCGTTVIWSSPPMVARIAVTLGSVNAACTSAARSCGVASGFRVVGYSTGSRPNCSRRRRSPSSYGTGNMPGPPNDGERTATRSPGLALGGYVG